MLIILTFLFVISYSKNINILIIGKTGVGKSMLVNLLMNKNVSKLGECETGTYKTNKYKLDKYGHHFNIYDTVGFFNEKETDLSNDMIAEIISKIKYCVG